MNFSGKTMDSSRKTGVFAGKAVESVCEPTDLLKTPYVAGKSAESARANIDSAGKLPLDSDNLLKAAAAELPEKAVGTKTPDIVAVVVEAEFTR